MASLWPALAGLPLTIEDYELTRLEAEPVAGHDRVTTLIRLRGGGVDGLGEVVSALVEETDALQAAGPTCRWRASGRSGRSATT